MSQGVAEPTDVWLQEYGGLWDLVINIDEVRSTPWNVGRDDQRYEDIWIEIPGQEAEVKEVPVDEREDKVKLSVYFIIAYLAYLVISYIILRFVSKFDLILGLIRFMRRSNSSTCCMKTTVIVYLCYFLLCPIIIALAWSFYIYDKTSGEDDEVIAASIFLMTMFSTFVLLGSIVWYGAKWHVSLSVKILLSLGTFAAWLFTVTVSLTKKNYTYSGASAILLATNFIPACYILHKKMVWRDVPIY